MLDERTLASLREALVEQGENLRREIPELGANADSDDVAFADDAGFSDRPHSSEERSRLIAVAKALRSNLRDVERALAKMELGTYGACERCGQPVGLDRLEAIPWATLCIACKQKALAG
ncbi:MAG: TraR/DksA C4-type zinc finger protein [Actinobacteria bacterium]|nr:TraR/DksA C4-type zinc finger protein [Actinomycetota bacterium]